VIWQHTLPWCLNLLRKVPPNCLHRITHDPMNAPSSAADKKKLSLETEDGLCFSDK
jgi:hypothetical protein